MFCRYAPAQSISAANIELINGGTSVSVTPGGEVNIVGNVNIKGNITCTGTSTMDGNITCNGAITASDNVTGGGISLTGHRHSGVETGGGTTGTPV